MKNNVFIFHGTEGHPQENWFPWLKGKLEAKGCKVFVPQFPTPPVVPAKISEWFDVLKEYEKHIDGDTILIGHSLGGIFALRVLEQLKRPIKGVFLVGTPIGVRPILNYDRDNSFSGFDFDWAKVKTHSGSFICFFSKDDPYVPIENAELFKSSLGAKVIIEDGQKHYDGESGITEVDQVLKEI